MALEREWQAYVDAHEMPYRQCPACGACTSVLRGWCTQCSAEMAWKVSDGAGVVYSSTVVHRSSVPGAGRPAPYPLAYIRLAEGPLVLGTTREPLSIGASVRAEFERIDGVTVPIFTAAASVTATATPGPR